MNTPLRQADRIGRLSTILGSDELVLLRFDGADYLNELFEYRVEALSANRDIDFDALVGTHATVVLNAEEERCFDGIVTQARWTGAGENGHRYDLTLRPWFWLAGRRRNQRIFHNKTVVQILQELLSDYAGLGDPALELALTGDYPELEYTVQYRESDLDFARRQMERHGISFYFKHAEGSHTLVLSDDVAGHATVGERKFHPYDGHHLADEEHFWEWTPERNLTTGAIRLTDYNFKTPMAAMEVDRQGDAAYAQGKIESFDYPGDYLERGRGKSVSGLRTDGERGGDRRYRAAGDCLSLGAGMRVALGGEPVPGTGESYVVLSAHYRFVSEAYGSGSPVNDGYAFTGAWTVMPETAPLTPPRRTPVPVVQGPQTAMVVGDGEIDCDEYGRILVRFHWDLKDAYSMRCRVSQNWAGAGWGGMVIPRIGMEVLVEFLEGDPDKPLVTGNVYNGKNGAPYELPANKTKAVWRSQTHQGRGYNEISFEDEQDKEELFVHAQKDHTTKVLNNQTSNVLANRIEAVGENSSLQIGKSVLEQIGMSKTISVGGNLAGLVARLAPLIQASGKFFGKGAGEVGASATVSPLGGGLAALADKAPELAALTQKAEFVRSGAHDTEAGAEQSSMGARMGRLLAAILPTSGSLATTVERFRQDTTGLATSEQVGMVRNVVVGLADLKQVGRRQKIVVGQDATLEAKRSIFNRTVKHTLHAKEKFVIGGPGGTIIIDETGVTIKARTLKIKSPSVDFLAGAPDQVEALKSDKPFVQECPDSAGQANS